MAELHRGARRYDLHLSGPQVVGIILGTLVTLGVTFGIGVGFGRRLATNDPPPRPGPDLAATTEAPDAGVHDTWTYPQELMKADPPPPPPPAPPRPAVVARATTATVAASPEAVEATPDGGTEDVEIGTPRPVAPPAPESAPPPPAAPPPAPPQPVAASAPTPAPPAPPAPPASPPKPAREEKPAGDAADRFTVQFTATTNQKDADRLAGQLKAAGYAPTVVAADVPGKGRLYRVRAGHFPTKEAAEAFRDQAQSKHKFSGMVMSAH